MTTSSRQAVSQSKKLHGFTLMEMIIVLGLIMIVLAIAGPAVGGYITRSRLNEMNADAKVIFTSAQTICQELDFLDRTNDASEFYGEVPDKEGTVFIQYNPDSFNITEGHLIPDGPENHNKIIATIGSSTTTRPYAYEILGGLAESSSEAHAEAVKTANPDTANSSFIGRLNRLFPEMDDVCFVIAIENYQVRGVLCASRPDSEYVGAYPNKATMRAESGSTEYHQLSDYTDYTTLAAAFPVTVVDESEH